MDSKVTLSYLAGFFDGEGSVSCRGHFVQMSLTNLDPEPLRLFVKVFGGRVFITRPSKRSVKAPYRARLNLLGPYDIWVIDSLLPYTIIKTRELKIAKRFLRECCKVKQQGKRLSSYQVSQRLKYKSSVEKIRRMRGLEWQPAA